MEANYTSFTIIAVEPLGRGRPRLCFVAQGEIEILSNPACCSHGQIYPLPIASFPREGPAHSSFSGSWSKAMGSITTESKRPTVTLAQGTVRGIVQQDDFSWPVECFLGVSYAQPPVGELRFRPPVAVQSSPEVVDASKYGNAAPGKPLIPPRIPLVYSEDCLTVNVFRLPPQSVHMNRLLPVVVYIHGGAFNRGNSSMQNTASMLGWSEEPFIAVSFNYRVGALGFLPSIKSAEEGILNLGFQDQRLLLQWVQDNIHAFGGDKNNVTLMGLSAGAIAVSTGPGIEIFATRGNSFADCPTKRSVICFSITARRIRARSTGPSLSLALPPRETAAPTTPKPSSTTLPNSSARPPVREIYRLTKPSPSYANCLSPSSPMLRTPCLPNTGLQCSGPSGR